MDLGFVSLGLLYFIFFLFLRCYSVCKVLLGEQILAKKGYRLSSLDL